MTTSMDVVVQIIVVSHTLVVVIVILVVSVAVVIGYANTVTLNDSTQL